MMSLGHVARIPPKSNARTAATPERRDEVTGNVHEYHTSSDIWLAVHHATVTAFYNTARRNTTNGGQKTQTTLSAS
jgi:hypothetical protein